MHFNSLPPLESLREILSYEPRTGEFRWAISRPGVRAGSLAGSVHRLKGYRTIQCLGGSWRAHRLAWLFVYGYDPEEQEIDHINGVRTDNRPENLRIASRSEQTHNSTCRSSTGVRGVWQISETRFGARLSVEGESVLYRQDFETLEDAVAARRQAEADHGIEVVSGERGPV